MTINTNERRVHKIFSFDTKEAFESELKRNRRMSDLTAIVSILAVEPPAMLLGIMTVLEVTTGLKSLRTIGGLTDYFEKTLKDEEVKKLAIMMLTIHDANKAFHEQG